MKLTSLILQYLLYMDPAIGLQYSLTTPHCTVFDSTSTIRPCNRVMHTGLPTADEIEQIKSFFGSKPFSWAVEEHDTEVMRLLESHQLSTRFSFPAMGMELDSLQEKHWLSDCVVRTVDVHNDKELTTFVNTVTTIFTTTYNTNVSQIEIVINRHIQQAASALRLYLGYYQGQVAAVGMSLQHGSIVTLHWIGTLAEYRRKGLGTAISYTALIDARTAGCSHAYLLASEVGKPLSERIGFKECARYFMYCNY